MEDTLTPIGRCMVIIAMKVNFGPLHTAGDYSWNMDALRSYDPEAHEDLLKTDPRTWSRAFFSCESSCEDVCDNLSKSFSRTIKEAKKLPVINMLEEVRRISMNRIAKLCEKTGKCKTKFPPKIMEILEGNRKSTEFCQVLKSGENIYEVVEGNGSFSVNLFTRECACRHENLPCIPCPHTSSNTCLENYLQGQHRTCEWRKIMEEKRQMTN